MIYVKRTPEKLDFITTKDFDEKIAKELAAAKKHYEEGKEGSFKFECYKHQQIKDKLIEMFNGKCAYCDSNITHITSGDIEHFRPKSIYWWLACEWDNLLFACEKCNRTGKNNAFPLLNNEATACKYGDESTLSKEDKAKRLLLNPCKENPEPFFEYDEKTGTISPSCNHHKGTKERIMSEKSIETYKLQRRELVQEREKLLILLYAQIDFTKKIFENYNQLSGFTLSVKQHFETRMKEEITKLMRFNDVKRPYLGMVRQVLRKFFTENNITMPESLAAHVADF